MVTGFSLEIVSGCCYMRRKAQVNPILFFENPFTLAVTEASLSLSVKAVLVAVIYNLVSTGYPVR